jgi:hypothetical protein
MSKLGRAWLAGEAGMANLAAVANLERLLAAGAGAGASRVISRRNNVLDASGSAERLRDV